MNKIDVSKCKYHNNTDDCSNEELDYICCSLNDCLYKQAIEQYSKDNKYKQCLDEIEEICKTTICDYPMNKVKEILQLIKQVKKGGKE